MSKAKLVDAARIVAKIVQDPDVREAARHLVVQVGRAVSK